MTESETSTTSTPRPEIADDVAAADDAPAVAGEPVAGDDSTTADTLTAAGEPAAGDDALTPQANPPRETTPPTPPVPPLQAQARSKPTPPQ